MKQQTCLKILFLSSIIGIILSLYSLAAHYNLAPTGFCTFGETLNCDVVNKSIYSEFLGIPVALLGVIGYTFLLVGSILKWKNLKDLSFSYLLIFLSFLALLFSFYLTGIEAFVLQTWCLVCVASQLTIFLFFIFSLFEYQQIRQKL